MEAHSVRSRAIPLKRRPVIQRPIRRDLHHIALLRIRHGHHPLVGMLRVVRRHHLLLSRADIVWLEVVVHERVVVLDAELAQQFDLLGVILPRRRGKASRWLPTAEVGLDLDGLDEDGFELGAGEVGAEFVRVAVEPADEFVSESSSWFSGALTSHARHLESSPSPPGRFR